ncbi:Hypothetical Protein FCC1311_092382 [Hondaea fermentalgiana]|uniref:Uncharacterized protein n=1 Tax=Hondaea fermentalgiana TaxID=2315210 RepID=A0A2R5GYF3_9STRA|nr:Hypothetical Protein FCC1311_092382 [Hondaea fermentalgiana]|eukprot:GBG33014.1 Hypothetical Protein FCC1311_092382 [Hondaea fermentalgiana]
MDYLLPQQLQTRSIRKNAHVEAWDGWRADSHKRFEMTASKVPALLLWGLVVPVAMFVLGNKEDNIRGGADYIEKRFIEDKEHFRLIHGEEDEE